MPLAREVVAAQGLHCRGHLFGNPHRRADRRARHERDLLDAVGMENRVLGRGPRALRIADNVERIQAQRVGESLEMVDPALNAVRRGRIGVGVAETTDTVGGDDAELVGQQGQQQTHACAARRAGSAAVQCDHDRPVVARFPVVRFYAARHNIARAKVCRVGDLCSPLIYLSSVGFEIRLCHEAVGERELVRHPALFAGEPEECSSAASVLGQTEFPLFAGERRWNAPALSDQFRFIECRASAPRARASSGARSRASPRNA